MIRPEISVLRGISWPINYPEKNLLAYNSHSSLSSLVWHPNGDKLAVAFHETI